MSKVSKENVIGVEPCWLDYLVSFEPWRPSRNALRKIMLLLRIHTASPAASLFLWLALAMLDLLGLVFVMYIFLEFVCM